MWKASIRGIMNNLKPESNMENLNDLVSRLSKEQPIEFVRPRKDAGALKESVDRNYVHILFKETGTELGVLLYPAECHFGEADFGRREGRLRLTGGLTLNYQKVKCIADLDLRTCEGVGCLAPVQDGEYEVIMGRQPV
jgi:hypothetical protein